jgi:pimeloyl-ACP methyl ester carboxylesterase
MRERVTFLPGAAGASTFWQPVVERLPSEWQLQLVDLPGLGSVPARPDVNSYDDLVSLVAANIRTPGAVVAQSMGAYVALQLALRHPMLVSHLVLVAATAGIDVARYGAVDWRAEYTAVYPEAQSWACAYPRDLSAELGAITIPVLLMWPTRDALSPLGVAHALASRLPTASLVTFESDDHWIVHQFPDEIAATVRTFIDSHTRVS